MLAMWNAVNNKHAGDVKSQTNKVFAYILDGENLATLQATWCVVHARNESGICDVRGPSKLEVLRPVAVLRDLIAYTSKLIMRLVKLLAAHSKLGLI